MVDELRSRGIHPYELWQRYVAQMKKDYNDEDSCSNQ